VTLIPVVFLSVSTAVLIDIAKIKEVMKTDVPTKNDI